MQFIITKQIAVTADTPEEAVANISTGQTISLNVMIRPQQGQPTQSIATGTSSRSGQTPVNVTSQ